MDFVSEIIKIGLPGKHFVSYYTYCRNGKVSAEFYDSLGKPQSKYGLTWPVKISKRNRYAIQSNRSDTCGKHGKKIYIAMKI